MPLSPHILFWGSFIGFQGGIERYAFQAAHILRKHGLTVDYAGTQPGRQEQEFRTGFDQVLAPGQELQDYDLAVIHKIPDLSTLRQLHTRFPGRLVFWAHDHDAYCPRHHYYTPFRRTNCHRPCSPLCIPCALASHPRNWSPALLSFHARLRLLAQLPTVVLSQFMADNLLRNGFSPQKIHLIHPVAPAVRNSPPIPADSFRLLFVGQLIRGKGCDQLIRTLPLLSPMVTLTILGDGKDRHWLQDLVRKLNLSERVTFAGWSSQPEAFYQNADLTVVPIRWQEPFGLVGLESLAHGVPVVAFNLGGISEWLSHERNGLLVPPGDLPQLAQAITRLQDHPQLLRQFSQNARQDLENSYTETQFLHAFLNLLNS